MAMTQRLNGLRSRWSEDADTLERWGHEEEARILEVCRSDLHDVIQNSGDRAVSELTDTWDKEADVLREYGHQTEANTLLICREQLDTLVSNKPPETDTPHGTQSQSPEGGQQADRESFSQSSLQTPNDYDRTQSGPGAKKSGPERAP